MLRNLPYILAVGLQVFCPYQKLIAKTATKEKNISQRNNIDLFIPNILDVRLKSKIVA